MTHPTPRFPKFGSQLRYLDPETLNPNQADQLPHSHYGGRPPTAAQQLRGQCTKNMASALQKCADTVTYIQHEGIRQRLEDQTFLRRYENSDGGLIDCNQ